MNVLCCSNLPLLITDIRYVQEMLGHAQLKTAEIYTQVNIQKLMEVHRLTHPAKLPESDSCL